MDINVPPETLSLAQHLELAIVDSIKFVGAHTISADDPEREYTLNFAKATEQSEQLMSKMEHRYISSIGASIIYNSKILSKFTHLLYNFHPSEEDCNMMNKRAMDFVRSFDKGRYLVKKKRYFIPHDLGGLNLRNFKFVSNSLSSHWLKQMQRTESLTNQNWAAVLRYHLSKIGVKMSDIHLLGYKDIQIIGKKLTTYSTFWSKTFNAISLLVRNAEESHKDYTTLPILGGTLAKDFNRPNLSIFSPQYGPAFKKIIREGYSRIQDFAKPNDTIDHNLLNCTKMITSDLLPPYLNGDHNIKRSHAIITAFISHINRSKVDSFAISRDIKCAVPIKDSLIQEYFNHNRKGCSTYYKLQLKNYIDDNNINFPPALQTAADTYFLDEGALRWSPALRSVIKAVSSPAAIDLSFKIFLRQNWTPLKESNITRNLDNPNVPPNNGQINNGLPPSSCKLCDEPRSNSLHMYIECPIADKVWSIYNNLIKGSFSITIQKTPETILFHQDLPTSGKSRRITKVVADTMLSIKKLIQNLNFRRNANNLITNHEIYAMFYNSILETIFSNKCINRLDDLYYILFHQLSNTFGFRKLVEFF